MYLKGISVQGFKSFADKIDLEFGSGITAIVGPNGSGKSNVSDAVRWVLGEQSAKTLRGSNMQDVIFAGTQKRKPLGFASVTITLDNKGKNFPIETSEVKVTRRVHRSGESEYLINNAPCRLKDIHELFMDTGLGRDGYSMIGQGKIDEILSSKSEDRRRIFEEAAGISKYKYKKLEAERKLDQTEDNLLRIKDMIVALEDQVGPLEEQSRKARTYLDLREKLKGLDVNIAINNIDRARENIRKSEEGLSIAVAQLNDEKSKAVRMDAEAEKADAALSALLEEINSLTEQMYQLERDSSGAKNRIELLENNIANNDANILRIDEEIAIIDEKITMTEAEIVKQNELLETRRGDAKSLSDKITTIEADGKKLDEEIKAYHTDIEAKKNAIAESIAGISDLRARKHSMEMLVENFDQRKAGIKGELEEKKALRDAEAKAIDDIKAKLDANGAEKKKHLDELEKLKKEYFGITDELTKVKEKLNGLATEFNEKQSKKNALEDLEKGYEGYFRGVKEVLNKNFKGVHGVVSKLIEMDARYAVAIEIALGNAVQHIIVDTEDDAKKCIEYLKSTNVGRATFLPVATVKGTTMEKEPKGEKGYLGLACDLITYDKKYDGIFKQALGKTAIVDNIDNAVKIAGKYGYKFKIVTLAGEVVNAGGSITGGSISQNQKLLSRSKDIERLNEELAKLQKEIDKNEDIIDEANEKIKVIAEKKQVCDDAVAECNHEDVRLIASLEQKTISVEELDKTVASLTDESGNILKELDGIADKTVEFNNEISALESSIESSRRELTETELAYISLENKKDDVARLLTDSKIDFGNICKDMELIGERIEAMKTNIGAHNADKVAKDGEKKSIAENTESIRAEIEQVKLSANASADGSGQLAQEIAAGKEKYEKDAAALKLLQKKSKEQSEIIYTVQQEIARIENKNARYEMESEQAINRLWEDYELTYSTALEYKRADINLVEAAKDAAELKKSIKALGNINIDAIDEYKAVKEKYDFMSEQKTDLDEAKAKLENIIAEMQAEMTVRFKECFAQIKSKYDSVFKELFGGGTAKLELSDPNDVLESGIEIEVQPPGKKLQSLLLLSGGERAFAAIALLFAVLEVRPTPFCILDEVEAALDDVNVYRFADYVKKYSEKTQFIVVTHRRGTMEASDIMYGVTMQEKGVSKILKLQIKDLEEENV
ncbi:MAG: chromosome segregation protein SMC [Clostridia bacterium]|nr:chromosome segregation protein SMC [Clostridia bacterium]